MISKALARGQDNGLTQKAALASLFAGALALALAPILVKLSSLGPITTAWYRLMIALPFFLPGYWRNLFLVQPGADTATSQASYSTRDWLLMVLAGLFFAVDLAIFNLSLGLTQVATATLFNNLAPIFVIFFSWFLFGERISAGIILSLIMTLGGMVLFLGNGFSFRADQTFGDGLAILTAIFYAAYLVTIKSLRSRHFTSTIMVITSATGAAILLPIMLFEGTPPWPRTLEGWTILIALGIVCHVMGRGLVTVAMSKLTVTFISFGLLLQPVAAACFAQALFGETLSLTQIVGGFLVLLGIGLARSRYRA
ncbi:MAG: DMT family transporter [Hyphomicrobiales bacterium]